MKMHTNQPNPFRPVDSFRIQFTSCPNDYTAPNMLASDPPMVAPGKEVILEAKDGILTIQKSTKGESASDVETCNLRNYYNLLARDWFEGPGNCVDIQSEFFSITLIKSRAKPVEGPFGSIPPVKSPFEHYPCSQVIFRGKPQGRRLVTSCTILDYEICYSDEFEEVNLDVWREFKARAQAVCGVVPEAKHRQSERI